MKVLPRFLYLFAFLGMVIAAALALDRALDPSMSADLIRAVIMGGVLGAAGLVHRKAWGVSLILLPIGAYMMFRIVLPPAEGVHGASAVYHFYINAFATGADQYASRFFPLALKDADELRLLVATLVYGLTGVASFLALSLRQPIPGVAAALLLLGFSFTVDNVPRVLAPALVFLVLAACVLALSRSLERRTWRLRNAIPGVLVGGAGAALAVLLLGAAPSAAATPWRDWRSWNPFDQGSSVYSFNWLQNYPQLLDPQNNAVIMRVESSRPAYWRANALDEFTGDAWISSQSFIRNVERTSEAGSFVYTIPAADPPPSGTAVTEKFRVRSVYTNYFFTGGDPTTLSIGQQVIVRMNDMRSLHVVNALGPSLDYTLKAVIPRVTPASLVGLGRDYPEGMENYLSLPFPTPAQMTGADIGAAWRETMAGRSPGGEQWAGLYDLNRTIIGGATDPYEIALRLERYLRARYQYDLRPPASDFASPYAAFLFDTKTGYCQHFAGSMALLLRFNGIPARVAVGFATGDRVSAGVYSVSTNNAHAWVEAYFPTVGWVAFDPTPGRDIPYAGASSTSPGFKDPFAGNTSGATTPTTAPDQLPTHTTEPDSAQQPSGPSWISKLPWLPWVIGLLVIVAAWPFARRFWRERGLRHGNLTERFAASLRLLRGDLAAYGVAVTGSSTFEDVTAFIDEHLALTCDPLLASRAGAVLFGGRHARSEDIARAEAFRKEVGAGLHGQHGWFRALLAWYGAPPAKQRGARKGDGTGAPARSPA
jgi:hypothetical protein